MWGSGFWCWVTRTGFSLTSTVEKTLPEKDLGTQSSEEPYRAKFHHTYLTIFLHSESMMLNLEEDGVYLLF